MYILAEVISRTVSNQSSSLSGIWKYKIFYNPIIDIDLVEMSCKSMERVWKLKMKIIE